MNSGRVCFLGLCEWMTVGNCIVLQGLAAGLFKNGVLFRFANLGSLAAQHDFDIDALKRKAVASLPEAGGVTCDSYILHGRAAILMCAYM